MKQVTLEKGFKVNEPINWDKPQWVQCITHPHIIVLAHGSHSGRNFVGTALPCKEYPNGSYDNEWSKRAFVVLETDVNFVISNKD